MSAENKKAPARQYTGLIQTQSIDSGNSSTAQQARLLAALRDKPVTTFEARHQLDVPHPAGRVQELRDAGYHIATFWCDDLSTAGHKHRVARYVLMGDPS
jgi:hypothetical protein